MLGALALFSISRYIVSTLTMFWAIEREVLFEMTRLTHRLAEADVTARRIAPVSGLALITA
jgi:hypothetical protein